MNLLTFASSLGSYSFPNVSSSSEEAFPGSVSEYSSKEVHLSFLFLRFSSCSIIRVIRIVVMTTRMICHYLLLLYISYAISPVGGIIDFIYRFVSSIVEQLI